MQDPILDLLGTALVPVLGTDIAAGTAGDVHLVLVAVAAVGADPDQLAVVFLDADLAVVAAALAVVGLGVQLGVHDVVVDELHDFQNGVDVLLHVGHLDVADGAAGGQLLELGLEGQFGEGVDLLGDMDVVGVGDIALVGDAGHHAESVLEALGKLVGGGLQRGAVEGEVDIVGLSPLIALVVHVLHHLQGEGLGLVIGVGLAGHVLDALVQASVAQGDGGVAAVEELVDGLALGKACQCAVLPQDGGSVGQGALQTLVAAHQGTVAQLQTLVEDLPELVHVTAGGQGHVHQIDGNDALVEAAVVLGLAVFVHIGGQEGTAAHAGVAVALAVGIHLQLQHLLLGDVVGDHALGGALGGQAGQVPVGGILGDVVLFQNVDELGECGGDPDALLILDALVALAQGLLDDDRQILLLLLVSCLVQVHEDGDEGCLAVGGHQGNDLILDGLDAAADLITQAVLDDAGALLFTCVKAQQLHFLVDRLADLLTADLDKGSQMGEADGLAAVLVGGHLGNDLGGNVAGGGERMRLLDEGAGNDGAVLEHVLQIHQIAVVHVLGIVVRIVEVDDAGLVGGDHFLGQQDALGDVLGHLARHVVTLDGVDGGVLVGVLLLDFLVVALDEAEDAVIGGVGLTQQAAGVAVGDVFLGHLVVAVGHDTLFHQVLDLLDGGAAAHLVAGDLDALGDALDLQGGHAVLFFRAGIGLGDGGIYLFSVKNLFCAVSFNDLHLSFLLGSVDSEFR